MSCIKLSIIIAGGGIGGLTAAIALRRAGHIATVLERSSFENEIGQAVTIAPNGGLVLKTLGLDFEKADLTDYLGTHVVDGATLKLLAPMADHTNYAATVGLNIKTAYRPDLHRALKDLAVSAEGEGEPATLVPGVTVSHYDADSGSVHTSDGKQYQGDLVIAADGIHSTAAEAINGVTCPHVEGSGTIVYRFTLPTERVLSDPETAPLLSAGGGYCTFNLSPKKDAWLLRYYCRRNEICNFAMYALRSKDEAEAERLRFHADRQSLQQTMEGFHPSLLKVAGMASDVLPLWRCATRDPLPHLTRGRLVVIGDAAHPVLPHLGLGAVSAIEDAGALGLLLRDLPATGDLDQLVQHRLSLFERVRKPRVAAYKFYSDMPYFVDTVVEDQRSTVEQYMSVDELPQMSADLRPWLVRYKLLEHVQAVLERSQESK